MQACWILAAWAAGALQLHVEGAYSIPTLSVNSHVICKCEVWRDIRQFVSQSSQIFVPETMDEQVVHILSAALELGPYGAGLALAGSLDRDTDKLWKANKKVFVLFT